MEKYTKLHPQMVRFISNGIKYGTRGRWWNHVSDSKRKNGGNCRRLNEAINEFGKIVL
jgi:hypothetical protein